MSLVLITPDWPAPANVVAYTTTRAGGVSLDAFEGLNVGLHVGDNPECVMANRAMLPHADNIIWLNQTHSSTVISLPADSRDGDASISTSPANWCAVMTADCVPVLLCDRDGTQVAAIHAGWQGLEKGIIGATVSKMQCTPDALIAWVGPAISGANYQVNHELANRFSQYPDAILPASSPDKANLDLPLIAQHQLECAGVQTVVQSGLCTYADEQQFYSHRRAQHHHVAQTGRMVSVIGLS